MFNNLSLKIFAFCLGVSVFWVAGLSFANAVNSDDVLYQVLNIPVDKTATSAALAREKGMQEALRKAYFLVLKRIIVADDLEKVPTPTMEELNDFVKDFNINDEKTSSVRYIANVNVNFKPKTIKAYLEKNEVPYLNAISEPILIVPVFKNLDTYSFDKDWVEAWRNNQDEISSIPFKIIDDEDVAALQIDNILTGNEETLFALQEKYKVVDVFVLPVSVENESFFFVYDFLGDNWKNENFSMLKKDAPKNYDNAVKSIKQKLEDTFKQNNVVHFSSASFINVVVPIKNLEDWMKIKKKLSSISLINKYELQAMAYDKVQLLIFFGRGIQRLAEEMASVGLILEEGSSDVWVLYEKGSSRVKPSLNAKPMSDVFIYKIDEIEGE